MDINETSAMTEASGLTDDQDGVERAPEARSSRRPLHSRSRDIAMNVADRLREVTLKAPLQSLFVAFLLGAWVARRR